MIVAVDAVGAKYGGAAQIARGAVHALAAREDVERVVVFASPSDVRQFDFGSSDKVTVVDKPEAEPASGRLVWAQSGMAAAVASSEASVVLALNAVGVVPGVPVVNYYQQPLLYDEAAASKVSADVRARLTAVRGLTWRSAREAAAHVVQTSWMRSQVSAEWKIQVADIVVATPEPPPWSDRELTRSDDLLWVGHELGYKRWNQAQWIHGRFRAFAPESRLLATLDEASGEGVEALGRIDRDEIRAHFDTVGALLVTSMAESLGLPLLEAMAAGCPIVAPDLPWARAVCDNAALYYDSNKPEGAVERLRDARQPNILGDLRKRLGEQAEALRAENGWGRLAETVCQLG